MGFIRVSERRQPQPECPRQDGPRPAHPDLRHCSNSPAHRAGPPPLLSACESSLRGPSPCLLVTVSAGVYFVLSFLSIISIFFFRVRLPGLPVELRRERGQPVGDQADPRLPALALHPVGQAVLPEL